MTRNMESWKAELQFIKSRCGFCGINFDKWQDRIDHIAKEFRNGATLRDWKGCRGFEPHIAAHVTNAMPPYLIANESKSPFPFSATNSCSMKHPTLNMDAIGGPNDLEFWIPSDQDLSNLPSTDESTSIGTTNNTSPKASISSSNQSPHPYATCWEILTLRLGRFARQHIEQNGMDSLTDAILQAEARRILYDEDDAWNQTAADNPEWLNLFKKAHGITSPSSSGASGPSSHEVFEDLGLRPNAELDKSFDLRNFGGVCMGFDDPATRAAAYECSLAGTLAMAKMGEMSVPDVPVTSAAGLASDVASAPVTTFADLDNLSALMDGLDDSNGVGGFVLGADGELHAASAPSNKRMNPLMAPIREMPCALGDLSGAHNDPFDFAVFDTVPEMGSAEFNALMTSAESGAGLGALSMGGEQQAAGWDDGDLTFTMDLDIDLDLGIMGGTSGV